MKHRRALGLLAAVLCALIIAFVCSALLASSVQAASFVVNSCGDAADANVGDGVCATAGGVCTLRAALQEANANGATADTITFSVGCTITLTAGLPALSAGNTTIAGANQTVTIDGSSLVGPTSACLDVSSAGNTIRGLIITHCSGRAINVSAANNTIGGATAAERNVISGNGCGVSIRGSYASGNRVIGNYIGTNATGDTALPNQGNGVEVSLASYNTIGGSIDGERNVISGNSRHGVKIGPYANGNTVKGNYIGTNARGDEALPNQGYGVDIEWGANNSTIGGSTEGERNLISGNYGAGVLINGFTDVVSGTRVSGNYIGTKRCR